MNIHAHIFWGVSKHLVGMAGYYEKCMFNLEKTAKHLSKVITQVYTFISKI